MNNEQIKKSNTVKQSQMIEEEKVDANRVKQSSSSGGMLSWLMGGNQV